MAPSGRTEAPSIVGGAESPSGGFGGRGLRGRTKASSGQPGASGGRPVTPRVRESVLEPPPLEGGDTGGDGLITSIVAAA